MIEMEHGNAAWEVKRAAEDMVHKGMFVELFGAYR